MGALLRRLGGFTAVQLATYIMPLLALPVIARQSSSPTWIALVTAQSLGGIIAVLVLFGWWTAGPAEYIAATSQNEQFALFRRSIYGRSAIFLTAVPFEILLLWAIIPPSERLIGSVAVVAASASGLSPGWFFVARAQPVKLLLYDALPRFAAAFSAILIIASNGPVLCYPLFNLLAASLACTVPMWREAPRFAYDHISTREVLAELRHHVPIAASNLIGSSYAQTPVPIASALSNSEFLTAFTAAERLYRAMLLSITALGNTLQPWVLTDNGRRRHIQAIIAHAALGFAGLLCLGALLPVSTRLLFGPSFEATRTVAFGFGAAFACLSVTTPLIRNILIPRGRRRIPLIGTTTSALIGLVAMVLLFNTFGLSGISSGLAISELLNMCICLFFALAELGIPARKLTFSTR